MDLPPPTFDLDTWASNYDGALLPLRLAHVARHCPTLARPALTLALSAAQRGKDVPLYTRLLALAAPLSLSDLATPDTEWVARQEEGNKRELARLDGELRGYKNNLIRESIRMGQEDIATHLLLTGSGPASTSVDPQPAAHATGYQAAYQAFNKMRDYCTTPTHMAALTLRLLYTSALQAASALQQGGAAGLHFNSLLTNAARLRSVGVKNEEQEKLTPIACAATGLAYLGRGAYRDAASAFLSTPIAYHTLGPIHGMDFHTSLASANDLAIYGGLCALATSSRPELLAAALDPAGSFRAFLELEPHMRKAISLYTTAKYQACLATLRRYYSDWSLDVFLGAPSGAGGSHLDRLLARIREKSITAYCQSFSEVSLASLTAIFPPASSSSTATPTMEEEVLRMIDAGALHARLDVVNGLLVAPRVDVRRSTHADARQVAAEVERGLRLRLHKVNVGLAGLEIPRAKAGEGWGGGGGGGGGGGAGVVW